MDRTADLVLRTVRIDEDYPVLLSWWQGWAGKRPTLQVPKKQHLPRLGLIVEEAGAVFLNQAECNLWIVDALITNPAIGPKMRYNALDLLVAGILEAIKPDDPTQDARVISWTLEPTSQKLWARHGGKVEGMACFLSGNYGGYADGK